MASTPTNSCYQIFLNHRGPDTKLTFTSHLYRRLVLHGFRVFWDKEEMQVGDTLTTQILDAIKTSSVHVAIFSPRYAESHWCLDELFLMVESGKPIIPVFHHVKPSELRQTQGEGVYAQALRNLEEKKTNDGQPRYNSTTIGNWRIAFSTVAEISGLELDKFNRDEGELLDEVVDSVLQKLRKSRLDVAEHPTGLDEKIKDFTNKVLLVQPQESGKAQVMGIVGLGGIGKTTLAKEFFNRKSSLYHRSCFLFDIRENARKASLELLQKNLLKGLTQMDIKIGSVSEGIELLKTHLLSCQALIILDDVDDVNQLDALLRPIRIALQSDSLILITSRDKDVLTRCRVAESSIYKLTGLNTRHSRELFCLHAFTQGHPVPGFEDLVGKYLNACDGLPLSLKVFGALLYEKDRSFWEDQLERLEEILPVEIQKRLQISYDALQKDEKQIFLDIACFFIGENRDTALRIWDGSRCKGRVGFQSLQNKSLVDVDIKNEITMHDHLRDLGRDLAKDPGLPCRLWHWTENIDDLLEQSSVVTEVRGIRMRLNNVVDNLYGSFSRDKLRKMKKLQLLDIDMYKFNLDNQDSEDDLLESILSVVHLPNLIWLRCDNSHHDSLPSWIPMMKLRVLTVTSMNLETLWKEASQAPLQLRELQIASPLLRDIPKSIGLLKHLEQIVLRCLYLEELPEEFYDLISLKHLTIKSCGIRSLPESFGKLTNLQYIDLSDSTQLEKLPDSFGNLTNLQHINLSRCENLERLPVSFRNLTGLKYLHLLACYNLTMSSETFGNICTLEYIDLSFCERIEILPSQLAHQKSLEILDLELENLIELPSDIGELRSLRNLNLRNCHRLKYLPDSLGRLNQLAKLTIYNCLLRQLSFKMVEGEGGSICPNLQRLHINGCENLVEVGTLPHGLIKLELIDCPKLRKIEGISSLAKLQMLNLRDSIEVQQLPSLETLVSLEELDVSGCVKLRSIWGLAHLTKLRSLDLSGCSELVELIGAEQLTSLTWLNAYACPKLQLGEGVISRCIFYKR